MSIDLKIKKLVYKSTHRGTRELDMIFSHFAKHHLTSLSPEDLDAYELFLEESETNLSQWIFHSVDCPNSSYKNFIKVMKKEIS
jgi:antitoxin CptB